MNRKYDYDYVYQEFSKNGYQLLTQTYTSSNTVLDYICENGHYGKVSFGHFSRGRRCKLCMNKKRSSSQSFDYNYVEDFFKENGCLLLSEDYVNTYEILDYICSCGTMSKISFKNFKNGSRCSECGYKKVSSKKRFTYEYIKSIFEDNDCELISTEYKRNSDKLEYVCSCGNRSFISFMKFNSGQRCNSCAKEKRIEKLSGENSSWWNPDISEEDRKSTRNHFEYRKWVRKVFKRDSCSCVLCNSIESLNAHHIDGYNWCVEKRVDVENGVTLCKLCHDEFHNLYGRGNNTRMQYEEWISKKRSEAECH